MIIPYIPMTSSIRPITLHAVNINIQLTTKQEDTSSNGNDNSESILFSELRQKIIPFILSNNSIIDHNPQRKRYKLKRIVQLAVFGISVLCGYLLL